MKNRTATWSIRLCEALAEAIQKGLTCDALAQKNGKIQIFKSMCYNIQKALKELEINKEAIEMKLQSSAVMLDSSDGIKVKTPPNYL